jgi:CBS domain-containing protein
MTKEPSCCLPGDSVSTAARIMKQQDVGPVLVVGDHTGMRLVGIVTDRDIALEVVADGRDPYSTRVDSVMSANLVTVTEDDEVEEAMKLMAEYQVRRIPVVDSDGRVVGIIAQADLARLGEDEQVGDLVEEISQPFGSGEWAGGALATGSRASRGLDPMSALAIGALCVGFGAGLMYMFDPSRGRKRRTQLVSRSHELWDQRGQVMQKAQSIYESARSRVGGTQGQAGSERPEGAGNGPQTSAVEPLPLPR